MTAGAIEVRTYKGQVLQVPSLRLSWASEHPRAVELMDQVAEIRAGRWTLPDGKAPSTFDRIKVFRELVVEVGKIAGFDGAALDFDALDIGRLHDALRGVREADPTGAEPSSG